MFSVGVESFLVCIQLTPTLPDGENIASLWIHSSSAGFSSRIQWDQFDCACIAIVGWDGARPISGTCCATCGVVLEDGSVGSPVIALNSDLVRRVPNALPPVEQRLDFAFSYNHDEHSFCPSGSKFSRVCSARVYHRAGIAYVRPRGCPWF
ncbi:uncharacterized protein EI90DRAFT_146248 [Cantharellus anzutake]|uniref:uncharacterized protein n=1 Tax=Cantharellus anzutake TaxID=1750568 RepID=UPI001902EF31|nr:uncharacterized protein EI90DRAFT_146248 [Cantharellus anzutake]KAF8317548.1 hypothetical protein EI90DRAFT_146248 [Cantharellus anzutake]